MLSRAMNKLSLFAVLVFLSGCTLGNQNNKTSRSNNLVLDPNAQSMAVIIGEPVNNTRDALPGIDKDTAMMKSIVDAHISKGAKIGIVPRSDLTVSEIVSETINAAKQVGPGGTLIWYFSGHGTQDGQLVGLNPSRNQIQAFDFRSITKAMRDQNIKVARLAVIIDACYSGNLVDGSRTLTVNATDLQTHTQRIMDNLSNAFEETRTVSTDSSFGQLILLASSRKYETSDATRNGSVFTASLYQAWKKALTSNSATVGSLLSDTRSNMANARHTPVWKLSPEQQIIVEPINQFFPNQGGAAAGNGLITLALSRTGSQTEDYLIATVDARFDSVGYCLTTKDKCDIKNVKGYFSRLNDPNVPAGKKKFTSTQTLNLTHMSTFTIIASNQTEFAVQQYDLRRK